MDEQRARLIYELYGDEVERLAEEISERRVVSLLEELRRVRALNDELLDENESLVRKYDSLRAALLGPPDLVAELNPSPCE